MVRPENFRDMGGIAAADGRRIKQKRLLRAGELYMLSEEDKEELTRRYALDLVVDFRAEREVTKHPDDQLTGVRYLHIDIIKEAEDKAASYENFEKIKTRQMVHAFMKTAYEATITSRAAQLGYAEFLQEVTAHRQGAVLFHCFAGKDRTGVAAALVGTLLDVPKEAIFEDYMRTNELRAEANEVLLERMRASGKPEQEVDVIHALFLVQPEYLQHAYDIVERDYGSMRNYITHALGVTEADIALLKDNYLE